MWAHSKDLTCYYFFFSMKRRAQSVKWKRKRMELRLHITNSKPVSLGECILMWRWWNTANVKIWKYIVLIPLDSRPDITANMKPSNCENTFLVVLFAGHPTVSITFAFVNSIFAIYLEQIQKCQNSANVSQSVFQVYPLKFVVCKKNTNKTEQLPLKQPKISLSTCSSYKPLKQSLVVCICFSL